jgi:hypothetical protein
MLAGYEEVRIWRYSKTFSLILAPLGAFFDIIVR